MFTPGIRLVSLIGLAAAPAAPGRAEGQDALRACLSETPLGAKRQFRALTDVLALLRTRGNSMPNSATSILSDAGDRCGGPSAIDSVRRIVGPPLYDAFCSYQRIVEAQCSGDAASAMLQLETLYGTLEPIAEWTD